jgi:hypothetical protein
MRDYFARPSSYHSDPSFIVKWENGLPKLNRGNADLRERDDVLLEIYHEAVRRDEHRINFFGESDEL